jgi:hypothetical protein
MDKVGAPRGLIRYTSVNGIGCGAPLRFTPRLAGYTLILAALAGVLGVMLFLHSDVEANVLRAPGSLFQQTPDGRFSNLYTVRILNKTTAMVPVDLKLDSPAGSLNLIGTESLVAAPQKQSEAAILIELDRSAMKSGTTPVAIGVYSHGKKLQNLKTTFVGPRN